MDSVLRRFAKGAKTPFPSHNTSPMQIRTMEKQKPPVASSTRQGLSPRQSDATHSFAFHQIEASPSTRTYLLRIPPAPSIFRETVFWSQRENALPASYFPFTEPSVEFDVSCPSAADRHGGRRGTCSNAKAPPGSTLRSRHGRSRRLGFVNYSQKVSGFAFGIGSTARHAQYGIDDIQVFFSRATCASCGQFHDCSVAKWEAFDFRMSDCHFRHAFDRRQTRFRIGRGLIRTAGYHRRCSSSARGVLACAPTTSSPERRRRQGFLSELFKRCNRVFASTQ